MLELPRQKIKFSLNKILMGLAFASIIWLIVHYNTF